MPVEQIISGKGGFTDRLCPFVKQSRSPLASVLRQIACPQPRIHWRPLYDHTVGIDRRQRNHWLWICLCGGTARRANAVLSSLPVNSGATATANSWAWINANTDNDRNYFDLRHASMQLWQRWMQMVPDLVATSAGGFTWDMDSETLRTFAACHKNWGYPVDLLSADAIAAKLPCLRDVPPLAAYVPTEMAVEPDDAVKALLAAAAIQPEQRHVYSLMIDRDWVYGVMTDDGPRTADEVILASGNGTSTLLESVGVSFEMTPTTGLLVTTRPLPEFLPHLLTAPDYHVRQKRTGQLLIGGTSPSSGTRGWPEPTGRRSGASGACRTRAALPGTAGDCIFQSWPACHPTGRQAQNWPDPAAGRR